jgi:hypothetical protein
LLENQSSTVRVCLLLLLLLLLLLQGWLEEG